MDITKMIGELREERDRINDAILALESLARGSGKRRGRPPKWLSDQDSGEPKRRSVFSAATRRKMALAQKRRWAVRKRKPKSTQE